MKTLLTQLAQLTVMLHMALGCAWHHGVSGAGCCVRKSGLIVEGAHHEVCAQHGPCGDPLVTVADSADECRHAVGDRESGSESEGCRSQYEQEESNHRGCHGDRCSVQSSMRFDLRDLAMKLLGLIFAIDATIQGTSPDFKAAGRAVVSADHVLDMGVRAHLLYGVLLL